VFSFHSGLQGTDRKRDIAAPISRFHGDFSWEARSSCPPNESGGSNVGEWTRPAPCSEYRDKRLVPLGKISLLFGFHPSNKPSEAEALDVFSKHVFQVCVPLGHLFQLAAQDNRGMVLAIKADEVRALVGATAPGPDDEVLQLPGQAGAEQGAPPFQYEREGATAVEYALPPGLPPNPHPMQVVHLKEGSYIWAPSKKNPEVFRWQSLQEAMQHRLFVSPVVEGKKTAQEALEGIKSETHQKAVQKYHRILGMADLHPTTVHDAVGQFGEPEHSFMATFGKFEKDKLTLAACTMGLVSEKPQLGVAMFERIPRLRKYGMLTARIAQPLEEIDKVMRQVQEKTGIYGWTVVPYEGFFEIVLCADKDQLDVAKKDIQENFRGSKLKKYGGKLHYLGEDDRDQAAKTYIKNIVAIAGDKAKYYLKLVSHNVPEEVFTQLAQMTATKPRS
jgi:hypothetical protein